MDGNVLSIHLPGVVSYVYFQAPESLSDLSYSPQSDVWSFGCVVYEIVALQEPHANTDVITIGIKIRDNGYTPQLPKRVDPFIKKLLRNIWQKDPAKRPVSILSFCDTTIVAFPNDFC